MTALLRLFRALATAVVLTAVLAACSHAGKPGPVSLSVGADIQGTVIRIHGEASVPDKAWIVYVIYPPDHPKTRLYGHVRVKDGKFSDRANLSGWPQGKITVDVNFQMGPASIEQPKQPDFITDLYGSNGQRMTGPSVVHGGGNFRAAVASTTVTMG